MQVQVTNSSDVDIDVDLFLFGKPVVDRKVLGELTPGTTQAYHVNTGTMMLVIRDRSGRILWKGPVPTFVKDPLVFSDKGVSYQGILIPSDYTAWPRWTVWLIIGIVLILLFLFCLWFYKRKR